MWTPEGLLDEHKNLKKKKSRRLRFKEIEQTNSDFPHIIDQLNNEQEKQNTQYKQDAFQLLIEKRFNLDAKLLFSRRPKKKYYRIRGLSKSAV